jgi:UDP-N-acetyl-D-galactosamine dehydrogenase
VLGLTFKENVPDLRNSKVADLVSNLVSLGHDVTVHDPLADHDDAAEEFGIMLANDALDHRYDLVVLAVPHQTYRALGIDKIGALVNKNGVLADLKHVVDRDSSPPDLTYWSL